MVSVKILPKWPGIEETAWHFSLLTVMKLGGFRGPGISDVKRRESYVD